MTSAPEKHLYLRKIVEQVRLGNFEEARRKLLEAKHEQNISEDEFLALEDFILAIQRKYDDAIEKMNNVEKKDANLLTILGYCYLHLNNLNKALDFFMDAIKSDKTHAIDWHN